MTQKINIVGTAPASINALITPRPSCAATYNGVVPVHSLLFTSAPASINALTTLSWPCAAMPNGVVRQIVPTPCYIRIRSDQCTHHIIVALPAATATHGSIFHRPVHIRTAAINLSTTLSWPFFAAINNGVAPSFIAWFTSALAAINLSTTLSWPFCAAINERRIHLLRLVDIRMCSDPIAPTTLSWPLCAAINNGVDPFSFA